MSELLQSALGLAERLHRGQLRKGTNVPYLSHLLAVSALVLEDGGSETEAAAALLHDAAEDQGGRDALAQIADVCGPEVAALVEECSDSILPEGMEKADWWTRKRAAVADLPTRSASALRIIAADKLHNTRSTSSDFQVDGPSVWARFKTGRDGFLWYHRETADALVALQPGSRSAAQLRRLIVELERESAPDPQTNPGS